MNACLRKMVGRLVAEACYYLGHWAWLLFDAIYRAKQVEYDKLDNLPAWLDRVWSIYQRMMLWSVSAQDWGGCEKPWSNINEA